MTLIALDGSDFEALFSELQHRLLQEQPFSVGEWQSQKLDDNPMKAMRELRNVSFEFPLPPDSMRLSETVGAHLPWAEDHFQERVSGKPLNPSPSEAWWPFAQKVNRDHKSEEGGAFSHTYPERMWATRVEAGMSTGLNWFFNGMEETVGPHGLRFDYGDLGDVVEQLRKSPNTRQAYLPIWFPEDTGAVHGKRVPCTLGYHFQIRNDILDITYYMRSCDLIRHFQDDVYMAGRLAQWMTDQLNLGIADLIGRQVIKGRYRAGNLYMHIANLHVFEGDTAMMRYRDSKGLAWNLG